jgi:hypothetical protein
MKLFTWLLLPLVLILGACGSAPADNAPTVAPAVAAQAEAVSPNPRALGDPNAPLKIVYYGDYQ